MEHTSWLNAKIEQKNSKQDFKNKYLNHASPIYIFHAVIYLCKHSFSGNITTTSVPGINFAFLKSTTPIGAFIIDVIVLEGGLEKMTGENGVIF